LPGLTRQRSVVACIQWQGSPFLAGSRAASSHELTLWLAISLALPWMVTRSRTWTDPREDAALLVAQAQNTRRTLDVGALVAAVSAALGLVSVRHLVLPVSPNRPYRLIDVHNVRTASPRRGRFRGTRGVQIDRGGRHAGEHENPAPAPDGAPTVPAHHDTRVPRREWTHHGEDQPATRQLGVHPGPGDT
jgi:hypothetical protein